MLFSEFFMVNEDVNRSSERFPWYDSDEDVENHRGMQGIGLANRLLSEAGGFKGYFGRDDEPVEFTSVKRRRKIDYGTFRRLYQQNMSNLLTERLDQNADLKREILRRSGYTHLYGNGGKIIPVEELSDWAIGNVFNKTRKQAFSHKNEYS